MLMTTDPGDLVLDPTCGSGTTAYVAEKWGRRWITCDTSRVAVTLAKQRLMTASYDYFELTLPARGAARAASSTRPCRTSRSSRIANNAEIDAIYERMHPAIEQALAALNAALKRACHRPTPCSVTEGARKGQKLALGQQGAAICRNGKCRSTCPPTGRPSWQAPRGLRCLPHRAPDDAGRDGPHRLPRMPTAKPCTTSPSSAKAKLRITGPFTVEAVPFPTVLSLDERSAAGQAPEADLLISIARSGDTSRQHAVARRAAENRHPRQGRADAEASPSWRRCPARACLHCQRQPATPASAWW
ncbi:MAG: DNA methyltransferase [Ottowia sp.]